MWVVECHGRRDVFRIFEFVDPVLETRNSFAQDLCSCLALSVVVLTCVTFLSTSTLLACGLSAVASLHLASDFARNEATNSVTIFRFLKKIIKAMSNCYRNSSRHQLTGIANKPCPSVRYFGLLLRLCQAYWPLRYAAIDSGVQKW